MKKEEFDRLLELYEKGRLSGTEKSKLERALDELRHDENYAFDTSVRDRMWSNIERQTTPTRRLPVWWTAAAAVLIIAASAIYLLVKPLSQPEKIKLPDGTLVWLKDDAKLTFPPEFNANTREVNLVGEALFEVTKDARPFTIYCGRYTVRVLGTSFNLRSTGTEIELTVLTGEVQLTSVDNERNILVRPRERILLSQSDSQNHPLPLEESTVRDVVAHTGYNMHFEDTPMSEIIARVEGKFDVVITVDDPDMLRCMLSADLTDQSLESTLHLISQALGISYELDNNTITFHGVGCRP